MTSIKPRSPFKGRGKTEKPTCVKCGNDMRRSYEIKECSTSKTPYGWHCKKCKYQIWDEKMTPNRKLGTCPITGKTDYYVSGDWGTESINCDECPNRCEESKNPSGYENEKGRYHGGSVFPKGGFKIFEK